MNGWTVEFASNFLITNKDTDLYLDTMPSSRVIRSTVKKSLIAEKVFYMRLDASTHTTKPVFTVSKDANLHCVKRLEIWGNASSKEFLEVTIRGYRPSGTDVNPTLCL